MGQKARPRPERLAAKLLAVRKKLGASQSEMARLLELEVAYARISEYEHGTREPNLIVLLHYARIAGIEVEVLIDDKLRLPKKMAHNATDTI